MSAPIDLDSVYPVDAEPASSQKQGPGDYPANYPAVRPEAIKPYTCDHSEGICRCVHDWRIHWGNPPKVQQTRAAILRG